ncbi:MAG: quinoprotein glucose dehydrogenase [Gammaproteobacteria bacterium]|nr:quinoprotein glucose dehydrogenase [Gammaproteobacteria bacterium]
MKTNWRQAGSIVATLLSLAIGRAAVAAPTDSGWVAYGGHVSQDRYSPLTQITPGNVTTLRESWRFPMDEHGDAETNPIVIGRTLYAYTPGLKLIALDGASGKLLWQFDAGLHGTPLAPGVSFTGPDRGLAYWSHGKETRLLVGVMNRLYALDPATGHPIKSFGTEGAIDLRKGLRGDYSQHYVSLTSPGIVYKDLIIVGFRTAETKPAPPGDIRAYDVRTGRLRWSFHTIPRQGEYGADTWPPHARADAGAANDWAGFALDEKRGIVYAPTGAAVPDMYGADRVGDNLFADSLLALDANTGRRLWHFQGVHHDIWDRDFPAPPSLLTVIHDGRRVDVVAQPTKQGYLYVFDRVSGAPLFPIEERPVLASNVPGEVASRTQPRPVAPEPYARQVLTEDMLTTRTPEMHSWAVQEFRGFRSLDQFTPFAVGQSTVVFPGFDGGAEWGGAAVDPQAGVIYINSNDVAWTGSLVENAPNGGLISSIYQAQCAVCHGPDRKGSPPAFPSLVDVGSRLTAAQITAVIRSGRGRMPAFGAIPPRTLERLVNYVQTGKEAVPPAAGASQTQAPGADAKQEMGASLFTDNEPAKYRFTGYNKFLDPEGYPAVAPPWGTLNAIDLNTGRYLWRVPLGDYPELAARGMKNTGSENYGGPIVTASGLLFIGATIYDRKIRAFESKSGRVLWEHELPFSGTATPATYMIDGKQYVVICTSNARTPEAPQGSAYVAFALP